MSFADHYPWLTIQPPPMPPPTHFRIRYGVCYCTICGFEARYCRGHGSPDSPASDGADSDLARRIAEARTQAGGR